MAQQKQRQLYFQDQAKLFVSTVGTPHYRSVYEIKFKRILCRHKKTFVDQLIRNCPGIIYISEMFPCNWTMDNDNAFNCYVNFDSEQNWYIAQTTVPYIWKNTIFDHVKVYPLETPKGKINARPGGVKRCDEDMRFSYCDAILTKLTDGFWMYGMSYLQPNELLLFQKEQHNERKLSIAWTPKTPTSYRKIAKKKEEAIPIESVIDYVFRWVKTTGPIQKQGLIKYLEKKPLNRLKQSDKEKLIKWMWKPQVTAYEIIQILATGPEKVEEYIKKISLE